MGWGIMQREQQQALGVAECETFRVGAYMSLPA